MLFLLSFFSNWLKKTCYSAVSLLIIGKTPPVWVTGCDDSQIFLISQNDLKCTEYLFQKKKVSLNKNYIRLVLAYNGIYFYWIAQSIWMLNKPQNMFMVKLINITTISTIPLWVNFSMKFKDTFWPSIMLPLPRLRERYCHNWSIWACINLI